MKKFFSIISVFIFSLMALLPQAGYAQPGALDPTFNPASAVFTPGVANHQITSSVTQADGKIIVTGLFTNYNGVAASKVLRLNTNGSIDESFNAGAGVQAAFNPFIKDLAIQQDGKIIIGGGFTSFNGIACIGIARINVDGSFDTEFNQVAGVTQQGLDGSVLSVKIQSDGKILVAGGFGDYNGVSRKGIARLNTDGTLDNSFNPGEMFFPATNNYGDVNSISLQSDGKIIISGVQGVVPSATNIYCGITRLNADGTIDNSFSTSFLPSVATVSAGYVYRTLVQPDGKILILGSFGAYTNEGFYNIARLNADGSSDAGFSAGMMGDGVNNTSTGGVNEIFKLQPDGKIILAGLFVNYFDQNTQTTTNTPAKIVRLLPNGGIDPGFTVSNNNNYNHITVIEVQSNQKIIIGGGNSTTSFSGFMDRLNTDGSLDVTSNSGPSGTVYSTAIQSDGKIIIGGNFSSYNGVPRNNFARINANGSLDESYNPSQFFYASTWDIMRLQDDDKLLIFTGNGFIRLNTDGSLDNTFNAPSNIQPAGNYPIALQPDGKIIISSYFSTNPPALYRLNNDGSLDASFSGPSITLGGVQNYPNAIKLQPDGKLIIAGRFDAVNGIERRSWARLNGDGSLDMGFDAGTNPEIESFYGPQALAIQADGKIISTNVDNGTVRFNANGNLDNSFVSRKSGYSAVIQPDGKIIIGGQGGQGSVYSSGNPDKGINRLNENDGSYDDTFSPGTGTTTNNFTESGVVHTTSLQSDGKIIIGGFFTGYDGTAVNYLARVLVTPCSSATAPAVNIAASPSNIICSPASVITFTATPTNGGSIPIYHWLKNGVDLTPDGTTNPTFSHSSWVTGDIITSQMISNGHCISPVSASSSITISVVPPVNPSVSIALTTGSNPTCSGNQQTFTASPVNGGSNPIYQWKLNGNINIGSNSATLEYSTSTTGNIVTCTLTNNDGCTTQPAAISNGVTVNLIATTWYRDADGDGYGSTSNSIVLYDCSNTAPDGYLADNSDCNDNLNTIHPGAVEDCNGIDDDCNDIVDDNTPSFTVYRDADGDGYVDVSLPLALNCISGSYAIPSGYTILVTNIDCDDTNPDIHPNAEEISGNGIDNNCDGQIDEGTKNYQFDGDGDGYGRFNELSINLPCSQNPPAGYVINRGSLYDDCDDTNSDVHPGAIEVCNGIDDNCDGQIDENGQAYYQDNDGDGYGNTAIILYSCTTAPAGYVINNGDCDDTNRDIHPGAVDICNNGIDEDCNGTADDQPITYYADTDSDGYGDPLTSTQTCDAAPAGYVTNNTDCDDTDGSIHPGAEETDQNGIDENCDGLIDARRLFRDNDNDGYGDPAISRTDGFYPGLYNDGYYYILDSTDCDDNSNSVHPAAQELCDGLDNDCNGIVDENVSPAYAYIDRDNDGYTDFTIYQVVNCNAGTYTLPPGYTFNTSSTDCDDNDAALHPGVAENLTNGIDDNCDGLIDVLPNSCDWNGSVSSNWQDPANWDCNTIPTGISIVNVPVVTNQPQLTADAAVYELISVFGATVDLNGHELSMSGQCYGAIFKGSAASRLVYENNGSGNIVMDQTTDGVSNILGSIKLKTNSDNNATQVLNKLIITDSIVATKGRLYTYSGDLVLRSSANKTASIAESNAAGNYIIGPVTVERYIPNNNFRSWRLLSVPTHGSGQTIRQAWQEGDANPTPQQNNLADYGTQITGTGNLAAAQAAGFDNVAANAAMLYWNVNTWSGVSSTNTAIDEKQAYFLYIRGERSKGISGAVSNSSATTLRTKGNLYMGNQEITVAANSFTVVPNLYASAIDFTGLTRTGVNNLFYIWDSKKLNGNSLGVYQTFSSTNSFNCLVSGGSYTLGQPNTMIESGQAFFVQGNSTGGSIVLHESSKRNGSTGLGFRPSPAAVSKIETRLYEADGTNMRDAATIVFDNVYSNAVEEEDAPKMGNPGENFAIETKNKILAIEGRQPFKDVDVVQFRMWNLKQQLYKLELAALNMNTEGLTAMLEDSYLKTATAVNLTGTTTLTFKVDANTASSAANRFRIVFSKTPTAITGTQQSFSVVPNPVENGVMNLLFKNKAQGKYHVRIINTAGHIVTSKIIIHTGGNATQNISLPIAMINGYYKVEIIAPDKSTESVSVLVKRK